MHTTLLIHSLMHTVCILNRLLRGTLLSLLRDYG